MDKLLQLLDRNARLTNAQLAVMTGMSEDEVAEAISNYEQRGIIRGYKALIDWDKTDRQYIVARIEVKVIPKPEMGFEDMAEKLLQFDEVETVYLMSGSYDIALTVSGRSFKDVAMFVARKLAPLPSVQSTKTNFVLKKYKERGVVVCNLEEDVREVNL